MTTREKQLTKILCKAIKERHLMKFYYESKFSGKKEWRTIRPYMVWPNKGNLTLSGVPIEELQKPPAKRLPGQYLLTQLSIRFADNQLEILPDTFGDPGIPRDIVDNTQTNVVCRFIYDDEDPSEVMSRWLKIINKVV